MRTDALTGKLAFLNGRWATPSRTDSVLPIAAANNGVRTILVTDNYMMLVPSLGGIFGSFFSEVVFIRGAGSDPWQPLAADLEHRPGRLSRSTHLEQQFLANARAWTGAGGPPWVRLFEAASLSLRKALKGNQSFLLWVDCFSTHEPWASPYDTVMAYNEPISPPYGTVKLYAQEQILALKQQYVSRLEKVSSAMERFVETLEGEFAKGDIAIVLLSDHGFLFGEFGLVGKPKQEPILPPLHNVVFRTSIQPSQLAEPPLPFQPTQLSSLVAETLGFKFGASESSHSADPHVQILGRNCPEAATLILADYNGFSVLFRDDTPRAARRYSYRELDTTRTWLDQGLQVDVDRVGAPWLQAKDFLRRSSWGRRFVDSIGTV